MADERSSSWWATFPGVLTAVAGVLTAATGLLVVLGQIGLVGVNPQTLPTPPVSAPTSQSPATTAAPIPPFPGPSLPVTTTPPVENPQANADIKWSDVDFGPVLGKGKLYVKPSQGRVGDDFEIGGVGFPVLYTFIVKHLSVGISATQADANGSFTMTLSTQPALCMEYTIEIRQPSTFELIGSTTYTTTGC
ncbi:hypothetical protein [Pseudarthrobacter sulfonivorans]|uniref:hypothetical protein n=1 Tax=Pseudarthrobacter sulfonivorans TaxID=121292 RepID=UPI0027836AF6|nr:hypothetical protein [Pseudarthrobacter sulfonivorans]MDQ0000059.1 hypothetical protein [Pseudarthrobacter sulfonivorans]